MISLFAVLGLTGITIILTSGAILDGFRSWVARRSAFLGKLIDCPMCSGFWVGLLYGLWLEPVSAILFAGLISLSSWAIYTIIDYFATKSMWYAVQINRDNQQTDDAGELNE